MAKVIVTYFSASGKTAEKAKQIARDMTADLYEIVPEMAYSAADLNWRDEQSRSTREMKNPASRPATRDYRINLADYDTVYIGFPIWWYTAPRIINTFLDHNDLSGKKIVLFATSGGSDITKAVEDLCREYPTLSISGGLLMNGDVSTNELTKL